MKSRQWFCLLAILGLSLGLRLWHLGQPARLVSDEWYFVQDAQKYARDRVYTDAHPPLGKLFIAGNIKLFGNSPWAWRIGNALGGVALIGLLALIAFQLTRRPWAGIFTAGVAALDGLLLTESRLALINLPYVLFGFGVIASILAALRSRRPQLWLAIAGLLSGLALADKWLAGLLVIPAFILWFAPQLFLQPRPRTPVGVGPVIGWLVGLPILLYYLVFVWHFALLGAPQNFWQTHLVMLKHHFGPEQGHPFRELWWRWPLLWQPFPYWSELRHAQLSFIWSMPNPLLWWIGWVAFVWALVRKWFEPVFRFVLISGLCAWLPLALIHRDMFLYHALPLSLWFCLLLGILAERLWSRRRVFVLIGFGFALASFIWFLPWYLNVPLSEVQHQLRRWRPTWNIGQPELKAIQRGNVGLPPSENQPRE